MGWPSVLTTLLLVASCGGAGTPGARDPAEPTAPGDDDAYALLVGDHTVLVDGEGAELETHEGVLVGTDDGFVAITTSHELTTTEACHDELGAADVAALALERDGRVVGHPTLAPIDAAAWQLTVTHTVIAVQGPLVRVRTDVTRAPCDAPATSGATFSTFDARDGHAVAPWTAEQASAFEASLPVGVQRAARAHAAQGVSVLASTEEGAAGGHPHR